ncbi:MAG: hypothetical protein CVV25_11655 [Ignavibacteriae bacterium HGW-Ignavibacteriae-4]|jgi:hypothetical protein|nr:MAG: hypothetical protein CVV25_11655 [Ignavibacteriae bacterium HGW-Ignavibacteriae-4]
MNEKNKWIDDIIESANSLGRVEPRSVVFDNILSEIEAEKIQRIPLSKIRYSIAAAIIIVSVNIYSVLDISTNESNQSSTDNELISNYNIYE